MKLMFILFLLTISLSCGTDPHVITQYEPCPNPPQNPNPNPGNGNGNGGGNDSLTYGEMQAFLVTYCQACHSTAGFMQNEAALRNSDVKNRLWNRSMPPSNAPKVLPDDIRTDMINFF